MAKPGTYAAYQQVTPIQEDFGENARQIENQQLQYKQLADQEKEREYQKRRDQRADLQANYDKLKPVITGIDSVDQVNTRLYYQGMEQLGQISREMTNPNLTREQEQALIHKQNMITKSPEMLTAVTQRLTQWVQGTTEGIQKGEVSKWDMYELEQAEPHFDMQGTKGFIVDYGPNGEMIGKVLTESGETHEISYTDIVNGFKFSGNTERYKMGDFISDYAEKRIGKNQEGTYENGMYGVKQSFDSVRQFVSDDIMAELGNPKNPSDLAKSVWTDGMGRDPREFMENPEQAMKEVHNKLVTGVEQAYDETFTGSQARSSGGGGGTKLTATERKNLKEDKALYRTAQGVVNLDPASLKTIANYTIEHSGKTVALGEPYKVGNELVFVDKDDNELQRVDLSDPEVAGVEVAKVLAGDKAHEVMASYETGKEAWNQEGGLQFGDKVVGDSEVNEQPYLKGMEVFDTLDNKGGDPKAVGFALQEAFKDAPVIFDVDDDNDDALTINMGGVTKVVDLGEEGEPRPGAIKEIKDFVMSKAPKKKVYKRGKVKAKKKTTVKFN